jgi:hypothetical protein
MPALRPQPKQPGLSSRFSRAEAYFRLHTRPDLVRPRLRSPEGPSRTRIQMRSYLLLVFRQEVGTAVRVRNSCFHETGDASSNLEAGVFASVRLNWKSARF